MAVTRERRKGVGEGESEQSMTKMRNWGYLRHRWVTAELRDMSVTGIALENKGFTGGGECLDASRGWEREKGWGRAL